MVVVVVVVEVVVEEEVVEEVVEEELNQPRGKKESSPRERKRVKGPRKEGLRRALRPQQKILSDSPRKPPFHARIKTNPKP